MTAADKTKFLEAIDLIQHEQGNDAGLTPKIIWGLFLARFPALHNELKDPFTEAQGLLMIAQHRGMATRSRRSSGGVGQMSIVFPGEAEFQVPRAIRVTDTDRRGRPVKGHRKHWVPSLDASVGEFGSWVREQERRVKSKVSAQREKAKSFRDLYRVALAGAKGDMSMPLKSAITTRAGKMKAKAAGLSFAFDFGEEAQA